jgi:HTH-type transcriptional regulator / antitoxin HigA
MKLEPLKTEADYDVLLQWVDKQFEQKIQPNTPEGNELEIALLLIKTYEDEHYAIGNTLNA